jgi:hypothetical protein
MAPNPHDYRAFWLYLWTSADRNCAAGVVSNLSQKGNAMKLQTITRFAATLVVLCIGVYFLSETVSAQVIDFSKIDAFESMGTGTLNGGSQPKTIIGDGEQHTVFLTIWESDTDTKVYWQSLDGKEPRTTVIPGQGVQAFQTAGEFKLEALGDEHQTVKYGYVLLRLKKQ